MFKIIVDKINYTNLINKSNFNIQKQIYYDKPIINNKKESYKEINDENFDEYDIDLINFSKI